METEKTGNVKKKVKTTTVKKPVRRVAAKKKVPDRDIDPLALYLKQISKYPLLTLDDEQDIGQKIQHIKLSLVSLKESYTDTQTDPAYVRESAKLESMLRDLKNRMITANLRLVVSIAKNLMAGCR